MRGTYWLLFLGGAVLGLVLGVNVEYHVGLRDRIVDLVRRWRGR